MPYRLLPPGKRGPCWYVRGTDPSGPFEYSTGQADRRAAARWVETVLLVDRARRRVPGRGAEVGFSTAALHYKAANPQLSKADVALVDALARHLGELDCRSIGRHTLVAAADVLKPGASPATKNRKVMTPGAAVLHFAADQRWCEYVRVKKFWESRKSSREPATDDTVAKLLEHLEDPADQLAPQWRGRDPNLEHKRLLVCMLYELGLRISDYLRIDWTQVDLQAGTLRVRIAKTDDWATVQISHVLVAMMANLQPQAGRLFPWSTRRGVYAWLQRVCRRAGVDYTPHQSRHAMATAAGLQRIPDGEAAKLGMWRDARSLHRYQHVQPSPIPGRHAGILGSKRGKVA